MGVTFTDLRERAHARRGLPAAVECRRLREESGLTQVEVAELVGCSSAAVSQWEAGLRRPRGALLERYLRVLRILRDVREDGP
jgi:transcriptional regulator with XRE-family HTH domain